MSEKVNCPFCGNIVDSDAYKCESCGSLFEEPSLSSLKFKEFGTFVALLVLTFGLFGIVWLFLNIKAINKLVVNPKDSMKFNTLIVISILDIAAYMVCLAFTPITNLVPFLTIIQCLIFMAITYRVLRIIQKYTQKRYGEDLEFNPYYIVFFNMLYLIHFIDTYPDRVLHIHEHFNPKSPQMILLILILLIIQFFLCWNTNVHGFYKWLFSL
jgi:hypothetical protein